MPEPSPIIEALGELREETERFLDALGLGPAFPPSRPDLKVIVGGNEEAGDDA